MLEKGKNSRILLMDCIVSTLWIIAIWLDAVNAHYEEREPR